MTATDLDEVTTAPAEPVAPLPPAPLARSPSAWLPALPSSRQRLWTLALGAALLFTVFGLGVVYVDDSNNQASVRSLTLQTESLTGRNQILNDQLKTTQTNLTATLGELAQTKAALEHPHLTIWNVSQHLKDADSYLAGGIPDTFTYHLQATSSGPMSVSILTLEQWASAIDCVNLGRGRTNYCMHHSGTVWSQLSTTSVNYDFHQAEGCADYIAVFTSASAVTVTP
ncbi:MAG TPA: hypothetical protein VJQ08_06635, partial [Candidatus Dormibacteraeota bacterium]|nr:hypothetical protein [Candidatus Dormibacteraeota bacterium]